MSTPAAFDGSQLQREPVMRWLRLLVPVVLLVVIWSVATSTPTPGLDVVGLAFALFVVASAGVVATLWRARPVPLVFAVGLLAASGALTWLQSGAAIAGIFVGVSMLAPRLRGRASVLLAVLALVSLGLLATTLLHRSVAESLLNAVMIGAFYGMFFLALRLREAHRRTQQLLAELEESRAAEARAAGLAERERLAREMHDVLAHSLSGLILQLEGARMLAAEDAADPRLPHAVERAHHLAKSGLDEARRAIGMLRGDELPGPEGLGGLAAGFTEAHGITCRYTVSGAAYALGAEARVAVFRVAQESLTNVTRHAQPERVEMTLAYEERLTRLVVEDFGVPPPADATPKPGEGYGLTGMRERAELLGGSLITGPTATGFRVELGVPA
ncbi:signal transduction histidine kinase [Hamadaea flava]|uniref:histidine kinase n=1 Tax=Hamadaea flava TaxID=1742688 RepID=A0ABV8M129_9ACTN|nr:histidine kinase [Hamadaea flava]MCP2329382.1 signal transduction histidine kinase [Hamadaea flava]